MSDLGTWRGRWQRYRGWLRHWWRPNPVAILAAMAVVSTACNEGSKSEPAATASRPSAVVAGSAAAVQPARSIHIVVNVDGHDLRFAIPRDRPAVFGHDSWAQKLGVAAVTTGQATWFHVAPLAKDAEDVTNEAVMKVALVSGRIDAGGSLRIQPGVDVPLDVFGADPPELVTITRRTDAE